jgi:hypothetical protein
MLMRIFQVGLTSTAVMTVTKLQYLLRRMVKAVVTVMKMLFRKKTTAVLTHLSKFEKEERGTQVIAFADKGNFYQYMYLIWNNLI